MPSADQVILSFPSPVCLAKTPPDGAPQSWNQLARTGSFVSNRYGKFSITRDDLSQMLKNFNEVTPRAPTRLPIDYDHLSMDPKKPMDGIAAGWLTDLELRENGDELWGLIEWTPKAAEAIENKEYQFVSPSFVKEHRHSDGKKIGTTLLAAAITNHPFLQGMKALTLYNFTTMGDLALIETPQRIIERAVHLAEVGQRVTFRPDAEHTPELTDEERKQTFLVKSKIGEGDDQFVRLTTPDGAEFGWFRATQLDAAKPEAAQNPMPEQTTEEEDNEMQTQTKAAAEKVVEKLMDRLQARAMVRGINLSVPGALGQAVKLATAEDAAEYCELHESPAARLASEPEADRPEPSLEDAGLRRLPGETYLQTATRIANERFGGQLRPALQLCARHFSEMAQAWENGTAL